MEMFRDYRFFKAFRHDSNLIQLEDFKILKGFSELKLTVKYYKSFMRDMKDAGYTGWIASIPNSNMKMHRIMYRIGALPYSVTSDNILYYKGVWK